jgi:hypothetical protein
MQAVPEDNSFESNALNGCYVVNILRFDLAFVCVLVHKGRKEKCREQLGTVALDGGGTCDLDRRPLLIFNCVVLKMTRRSIS